MMHGMLSFRFLSVIRQTFWGLQYPFIDLQTTPFRSNAGGSRYPSPKRSYSAGRNPARWCISCAQCTMRLRGIGELPSGDRTNRSVGQPVSLPQRDVETAHPEARPHLGAVG